MNQVAKGLLWSYACCFCLFRNRLAFKFHESAKQYFNGSADSNNTLEVVLSSKQWRFSTVSVSVLLKRSPDSVYRLFRKVYSHQLIMNSLVFLIKGMPPAWRQWLQDSNITACERKQNPELVIEVLQCYDAATQNANQQKFMTQKGSWGKQSLHPPYIRHFTWIMYLCSPYA